VKIEAAKRSLEASRKNVNEVMYSVGYVDVKAFRSIFKKVAGVTPQEYKMKFGTR
jgi:YesN/AraC family two-component response regulator